MTRILLARHGQSEWNAEGRWQGHADPPLSSLGRHQAAAASRAVGSVDAVVSSDLQRARHTAEIIADAIGVGPVEIDARLRERDAGEWTGLTRAEIERDWPGALAEGHRPPGFELDDDVIVRVLDAVHDLAARYDGGDVLAVAHGGVIRALERHLGVETGLLPNLGGRWVEVHGPAWLDPGDRIVLVDPDEVAVTTPQQL
jgi:broad specificity phosphatase PhoE